MPIEPLSDVGAFSTGALGTVCGTAGPPLISVETPVAIDVLTLTRNEYSFPLTSGTPLWLLMVTEVAVETSDSATQLAPLSAVDSII